MAATVEPTACTLDVTTREVNTKHDPRPLGFGASARVHLRARGGSLWFSTGENSWGDAREDRRREQCSGTPMNPPPFRGSGIRAFSLTIAFGVPDTHAAAVRGCQRQHTRGDGMKYDLRITGGTVVDPARDVERTGDVFVRAGRIAPPPASAAAETERAIDVTGCVVVPGLIDFHLHLYAGGTEIGIEPDLGLLPQGVTTAVDAGSAGIANYDLFSSSVVARSVVRIKSFLHVSPAGLATTRYPENVDPCHFDPERMAEVFARHRGEVLGLKVRQSRSIVGALGFAPLRATLQIAESLGCPVVVHVTDPPGSAGEIADLLRSGDVFCHVFHGTGGTILGSDGGLLPEIHAARARGVLFDAANGRSHFAFAVARAALRQSFLPDVISTDVTVGTLYGESVFGLPHVMSKYLTLGVPLRDVVAACTMTPARVLGLEGEIGTLAPGACADIAVFRQTSAPAKYVDALGERLVGQVMLVPQLTVRAGRVVYRQPTL